MRQRIQREPSHALRRGISQTRRDKGMAELMQSKTEDKTGNKS